VPSLSLLSLALTPQSIPPLPPPLCAECAPVDSLLRLSLLSNPPCIPSPLSLPPFPHLSPSPPVQSMPLWTAYIDFMTKCWREGGCPLSKTSKVDAPVVVTDSDVRAVCEEALTHLGLHPSAGDRIWAACRAFEAEVLSQMLASGNATTPKVSSAVPGSLFRKCYDPQGQWWCPGCSPWEVPPPPKHTQGQ